MAKKILESSKDTFQWYLDSLELLNSYSLTLEQHEALQQSIATIETILNSLEVEDPEQ